jgi:hypothetical protein
LLNRLLLSQLLLNPTSPNLLLILLAQPPTNSLEAIADLQV